MQLSNKVIFPILLFFVIYASCTLVYLSLFFIDNTEYRSVVFSIVLIAICGFLIKKYKLPVSYFRQVRIERIPKRLVIYSALIIILFVSINIIQNSISKSEQISINYLNNIGFYIGLSFPIKAFGEEFLYRGLILPYLETKTIKLKNNFKLSNIITSILMTIPHIGFLYVMTFPNALLGLVLVFIASLYFGYLAKVTKQNVLICGIVHTLFNYIHFFIYCYF
ncbi:CPBP family intramembrane metalloprotease [Myroides marinus]|uniref:CPBP family intramembrane glutamic endopeptidase n=1 Tax=Myroides marinus TaxID=703342 RepID=UPI00258184DF|nr:CPBP family intramembrane metalloprotease [Myroides marinus]